MNTPRRSVVLAANGKNWDLWFESVERKARLLRIWEMVDPVDPIDKPRPSPLVLKPMPELILPEKANQRERTISTAIFEMSATKWKEGRKEYARQRECFMEMLDFIVDSVPMQIHRSMVGTSKEPLPFLKALKQRFGPTDYASSFELARSQRTSPRIRNSEKTSTITAPSTNPKLPLRLQTLKELEQLISIHGRFCPRKTSTDALIKVITVKMQLLYDLASGSSSFAEILGNLERLTEIKSAVQQQNHTAQVSSFKSSCSCSFEMIPILNGALEAQVGLLVDHDILKVRGDTFLKDVDTLARLNQSIASGNLGGFLVGKVEDYLEFLSPGGDTMLDD